MSLELWVDDKFAAKILDISGPEANRRSEFGGPLGVVSIYTAKIDSEIDYRWGFVPKIEIRSQRESRVITISKPEPEEDYWIVPFEYCD